MERRMSTYMALCALRVALAFTPGYIHPDEWFQYGEPLVGDLFAFDTLRTWEFDPSYPCRSMASIRLFAMPIIVMRSLLNKGDTPSGHLLFVVQRTTFLTYSFACDLCLWSVLRSCKVHEEISTYSMFLFAVSGASLTFGPRSFSNNIEALLLAVSIAIYASMVSGQSQSRAKASGFPLGRAIRLACLASVAALGVFCRFTFVLFLAPVVSAILCHTLSCDLSVRRKVRALAFDAASAILPFTLVSAFHIAYDSQYYAGQNRVLAPLNAALYNVQAKNLAQHGTHPLWLHTIVNAPIILGIGSYLILAREIVLIFSGSNLNRSNKPLLAIQRLCAAIIVFALATLSIQPHQEPRFLLPILLPSCILVSSAMASSFGPTARTALSLSSVAQSSMMVALFAFSHQAGLLPALFSVALGFGSSTDLEHVFVWRSFMPPRHLLSPSRSIVHDLGSRSGDDVVTSITKLTNPLTSAVLLAPLWVVWQERKAMQMLNISISNPLDIFRPHLDMDHLEESVRIWTEGEASVGDIFSYGIWGLSMPYGQENDVGPAVP